jgi:GTP-binding protein Era
MPESSKTQPPPFKVGFAALVGKPNVGKSTLMNRLLGRKLSIVTPKPQTTRRRILGIKTGEDHQVVFIDTPGLLEPKYLLQKAMVQAARDAMAMADLVLWMEDASRPADAQDRAMDILRALKQPKLAVLNKIDLVAKRLLLPRIDRIQQTGVFDAIVPVSALHNDGVDLLFSLVRERLPEGHSLYLDDVISDEPERFFVAEIIREQVFLRYQEEIPYACAVRIEAFEERPGRKDFIRAVVAVEQDSQKGILIGRGAAALKAVGERARARIETFLGRPVYLELIVRVEKDWRSKPDAIRGFGYG